MIKGAEEYNWEEVRDALYAYVSWLEENEPQAVNTIATFQNAADECPMQEDF